MILILEFNAIILKIAIIRNIQQNCSKFLLLGFTMIFKKLDINYVSPEEKFLYSVDKKIPLSKSQIREIEKAKRIAKLRDNRNQEQKDEIWDKF